MNHFFIPIRIILLLLALSQPSFGGSLPYGGMTEKRITLELDSHTSTEGVLSAVQKARGIALILPGSGNIDSSGDVSGPLVGPLYQAQSAQTLKAPKLSEQLAIVLAEHGLTSLRYNKRGYENPNYAVPFPVLKADALTAFRYLKGQYPTLPLYLVGLSEGALISIHLTSEISPAGIFLLSPPPGPIHSWLHYMFVDWPVNLIENQIDVNHDGKITQTEFDKIDPDFKLPLFGVSWKSLDANHDGILDLENELKLAYETNYLNGIVGPKGLAHTPTYQDWYTALVALENPEQVLARYSGKTWHYMGTLDAQVSPEASLKLFKVEQHGVLRKMEELGHCFSHHEGKIGEIKTAGPLNDEMLNQLGADLEEEFKR